MMYYTEPYIELIKFLYWVIRENQPGMLVTKEIDGRTWRGVVFPLELREKYRRAVIEGKTPGVLRFDDTTDDAFIWEDNSDVL